MSVPSEAGGRAPWFNGNTAQDREAPRRDRPREWDVRIGDDVFRQIGGDWYQWDAALAEWRTWGVTALAAALLTEVCRARLASRSSGDGERDREDAERWRFLRDNPLGLRAVDGNAKYPPPTAEQMDWYVDHAREDAAIIAEAAAEIRAARAAEGSDNA